MGKTTIQWTDRSVNPVLARIAGTTATKGGFASGVGHYCEKVSKGCRRCYSSAKQPRFGLPQFQDARNGAVEVFFSATRMLEVLKCREPQRFFWCDMSDMFGRWVPDLWIAAMYAVMAATPQHTHQVLTKRDDRLVDWYKWIAFQKHRGIARYDNPISRCLAAAQDYQELDEPLRKAWSRLRASPGWPLPNVHLGVSVEDQAHLVRIEKLRVVPAAVRFVSFEPLIEDLGDGLQLAGVDQGIVGGESGHGASRLEVAWVRRLIRQLRRAGAAVFVKQLGAHVRDVNDGRFAPSAWEDDVPGAWPPSVCDREGAVELNLNGFREDHQGAPVRVRLLDRTHGGDWEEWPRDLRHREPPGKQRSLGG